MRRESCARQPTHATPCSPTLSVPPPSRHHTAPKLVYHHPNARQAAHHVEGDGGGGVGPLQQRARGVQQHLWRACPSVCVCECRGGAGPGCKAPLAAGRGRPARGCLLHQPPRPCEGYTGPACTRGLQPSTLHPCTPAPCPRAPGCWCWPSAPPSGSASPCKTRSKRAETCREGSWPPARQTPGPGRTSLRGVCGCAKVWGGGGARQH